METETLSNLLSQITNNISSVIIGKEAQVKLVLAAILADGHVLLEDVPGTGKTMLAKSLAKSFDCEFGRIQFTPDLLPSELTGINFYSPKTGEFSFRKGSLFANIILADEINRATPRTQSGLLESMEERQVTVDGETRPLPPPYFVIATQNPVETHGTFPLPEAQLDRFLLQLKLGYPEKSESISILKGIAGDEFLSGLKTVCSTSQLLEIQQQVKKIYVHDDICQYIVELCQKTREHESVALGISTRGMLALQRASRAYAVINGRGYVIPEDVKYLLPYVFAHRLMLRGRSRQITEVINEIIEAVKVPTENWKPKS